MSAALIRNDIHRKRLYVCTYKFYNWIWNILIIYSSLHNEELYILGTLNQILYMGEQNE